MLIANIKEAWKFWSLQLGVLGTAIASLLLASPEAAMATWNLFPLEFRQFIPPQWMPFIGVFLFACSMIARVIQQHNLRGTPDADKTV